MKPLIAVVGGFLGAGKTTLILAAARILEQRGLRVAVILNDQGDDLVDTHYACCQGVDCDQVTGGCFCCRFPDLVEAAGRLLEHQPDVIFAEAVGSCTDIVATTLRPLLRDHSDRFRIAPLTVVLHPQPAFDNPDLDFLYSNQLAEADLLFARGESVQSWIDRLLSGSVPAGVTALDIDYARYAEAEAALAWLNARVTAHAAPPISAPMLIGPLLDRLEPQIRIVHLKLLAQSGAGYLKAALTAQRPGADRRRRARRFAILPARNPVEPARARRPGFAARHRRARIRSAARPNHLAAGAVLPPLPARAVHAPVTRDLPGKPKHAPPRARCWGML